MIVWTGKRVGGEPDSLNRDRTMVGSMFYGLIGGRMGPKLWSEVAYDSYFHHFEHLMHFTDWGRLWEGIIRSASLRLVNWQPHC